MPAPRRPFTSTIPILTLFLVLATQARTAEPVSDATADAMLQQAWKDASSNLFLEAAQGFAKAEGREARLGGAITLLARQPKTASNIEAAAKSLTALVEENSRDTVGVMARYYLGRVEQVHRVPSNPAAAAAHFRRLLEEHPGEFWTEQGAIKLALIELHEEVGRDERLARLTRHAEYASSMRHRPARRDMHLLLADVILRFQLGEALALEQLLAADEAGIVRSAPRAQVWVQIAELARETGREDIARRYYESFLASYKRDTRRKLVSERLAALSANTQEVAQQ